MPKLFQNNHNTALHRIISYKIWQLRLLPTPPVSPSHPVGFTSDSTRSELIVFGRHPWRLRRSKKRLRRRARRSRAQPGDFFFWDVPSTKTFDASASTYLYVYKYTVYIERERELMTKGPFIRCRSLLPEWQLLTSDPTVPDLRTDLACQKSRGRNATYRSPGVRHAKPISS